jgi:outer membrane biosynthesis protein TonB
VSEIKAFLSRHMKAEPSNVSISQQLNESLWKGGVHNAPAKIKVKVSSDEEEKVFARLMEEKEKPKVQKKSRLGIRERLARRREAAKEEKEPEKPAAKKKEEKKPELKKETPPQEAEQDILLEQ